MQVFLKLMHRASSDNPPCTAPSHHGCSGPISGRSKGYGGCHRGHESRRWHPYVNHRLFHSHLLLTTKPKQSVWSSWMTCSWPRRTNTACRLASTPRKTACSSSSRGTPRGRCGIRQALSSRSWRNTEAPGSSSHAMRKRRRISGLIGRTPIFRDWLSSRVAGGGAPMFGEHSTVCVWNERC